MSGICKMCGKTGELGAPCTREQCKITGLHLVTEEAKELTSDPLLGVALSDKYILIDRIGVGGFGKVYLALQAPLARRVAVKVITSLLPEGTSSEEDADLINEAYKRFLREATAMTRVSHPNIVTLIDFGEAELNEQQFPFLVMEFIDGGTTLRDRLDQGPMTDRDSYRVFNHILEALKDAHEQGLIHRDLKPENVMIIQNSTKLLDFGLTKAVEQARGEALCDLTQEGLFVGTPAYTAPEQGAHWLEPDKVAPVDQRSDLYSLGVMLYEAWTGITHLFGTQEPIGILSAKIEDPEYPLRAEKFLQLSKDKQALLRYAMATSPEDRFPDAGEMLRALDKVCLPRITEDLSGTFIRPKKKSAAQPTITDIADNRPQKAAAPTLINPLPTKPKTSKKSSDSTSSKQLAFGIVLLIAVCVLLVVVVIRNLEPETKENTKQTSTEIKQKKTSKPELSEQTTQKKDRIPEKIKTKVISQKADTQKTIAPEKPAEKISLKAPEKEPEKTPEKTLKPTDPSEIIGKDGVIMDRVPAGTFYMGTKDKGGDDEKPGHTVELDTYYIDRFEVTSKNFERCVKDNKCLSKHFKHSSKNTQCNYGDPKRAEQPMNCVDWEGMGQYCKWAGKRLPTEAEWEKAARGSQDNRLFPWGDEKPTCERVIMDDGGDGCGQKKAPYTSVVGSRPAGIGPYGTHDLAGNIYEWCADYYSPDYYKKSPAKNPKGPKTGNGRVVRGGSWRLRKSWVFRNSDRTRHYPHRQKSGVGGRCVQDEIQH